MSQEQREYKRSNYFIKKEFQIRFIIKFCLILLGGIILSSLLVFLFSQETLTSSFENSRLVIKNTGDAIIPTLVVTNLATLAVITIAAIGVTLFVSHRVAGPMFRFEQDIKRIAAGDLRVRINLRQKDQFPEMAKSFNEMTVSMHKKIAEIDEKIEELLIQDARPRTVADYEKEVAGLKEMIHKNFSL